MIIKVITNQDANYKWVPVNSRETSINLSQEIASFIAPNVEVGGQSRISFIVHKEDYLKALGFIANMLPLYISSSSGSVEKKYSNSFFIDNLNTINSFFGNEEVKTYSANYLYRNDGRFYLNDLNNNGFNIRDFLVSYYSILFISKSGNSIDIRLATGPLKGNVEKMTKEERTEAFFEYIDKTKNGHTCKNYKKATKEIQSVGKPIQDNIKNLELPGTLLDITDLSKISILYKKVLEDPNNAMWNQTCSSTVGCYRDFILSMYENPKVKKPIDTISDPSVESNALLQQIFYGAPGTGKSHKIKECTEGDDTVIRTTFHPDSDYSTFVGAYKPTMGESKPIYGFDATGKTVKVEDPKGEIITEQKIEYKFVQQAFTKAYIRAWKKLAKPEFLTFTIGKYDYTISDVDDVKITITKTTATPDDGKYSHKEVYGSSAEKGHDIAQNENAEGPITIFKDEMRNVFNSKNPNINPNINDSLKEGIKGRLMDGNLDELDDFDGLWGKFKEKLMVAEFIAYKPQFLIIEELNRGNCAQIFGDLFQLLDRKKGYSEYPIEPDEDLRKELEKEFAGLKLNTGINNRINSLFKENYRDRITEKILKGELLVLPENLYIWATMNTSDQSLFPIDSAFKRRWDWKYVPIDTKKEKWDILVNGHKYSWTSFLDIINDEVLTDETAEDKHLGFYFCKAENNIISAEKFVGKVLFYLWNDVFKVYGVPARVTNGSKDITYTKFYNPDGSINENMVEKLLDNLKVDNDKKKEHEEVVE